MINIRTRAMAALVQRRLGRGAFCRRYPIWDKPRAVDPAAATGPFLTRPVDIIRVFCRCVIATAISGT